MEGYRNSYSNGKVYTLRKDSRIVFIGNVSDIANRFDVDTPQIYASIREHGTFMGMDVKEKLPTDVMPTRVESRKYEPKKYHDSSSARFTPL